MRNLIIHNGLVWRTKHSMVTPAYLGLLPGFLSVDDDRPAKEQLHENYAHGGGWHTLNGFRLEMDRLYYGPDDREP